MRISEFAKVDVTRCPVDSELSTRPSGGCKGSFTCYSVYRQIHIFCCASDARTISEDFPVLSENFVSAETWIDCVYMYKLQQNYTCLISRSLTLRITTSCARRRRSESRILCTKTSNSKSFKSQRELNSKSNSLHLSKDFLLFTDYCLQDASLFLIFSLQRSFITPSKLYVLFRH